MSKSLQERIQYDKAQALEIGLPVTRILLGAKEWDELRRGAYALRMYESSRTSHPNGELIFQLVEQETYYEVKND